MRRNRQKLLAALAIAVVALLVMDKVILTPMFASWKERSERIGNLRQSVDTAALLIDREESLRDQWQEMRGNMLPANPSATENAMLKAFEKWASESRVSISGIRPQWKRLDEQVALECNADINGDLEALTKFLRAIENDEAGFRIQRVELASRNEDGSRMFMGIQVSGLPLVQEEVEVQ